MTKKNISIDVMVGGVCLCTLQYPYNPLFKLDLNDVADFVYRKCPTLRDKNCRVIVDLFK